MMNEQQELFAIASPCIGVCQVNNKGYCKGCLRDRNERLYWHTFSEAQRSLLLKALAARRQALLRKQERLGLQASEEQLDLFAWTPEQQSLFDELK